MSNPSEEDILNAINASGYLFEQEIGSILEKNSFHIQTNAAFKDEDEDTSREIDVMGYQRFYWSEEKKISIGVTILCECKNNQSPFVFIKRNKSAVDKFYCPPNFLFPRKEFDIPIEGKSNSFNIVPAFKHFQLDKIFPYNIAESKAVQFCKIIRKGKVWNAFHDGIYDNILLPIIKCLEYFKKKDSKMLDSEWNNYFIYFPIVVLNSQIYSIDSHLTPDKLTTLDFLSFTREIDSKKIKGKYLIDFVTKGGLQSYLDNHLKLFVEKFIEQVVK